MLDRHAPRFANELRQAGLMDGMAMRGAESDTADMLQAFDQPQHGAGSCGLRHLPQPGQPGLASTVGTLREGIETATLLRGQAFGQPPLHFAPRLLAQPRTKPLQSRGRRHDNPLLPAGLHHHPGHVHQPIVLDRLRQQAARQFRRRAFAERAKPKPCLTLE
jgi:hypothetical protein